MANENGIGLGLIGCGAFGVFCMEAFGKMDEVRIAAVADVRAEAADRLARALGVPAFHDPAEMFACEEVTLVHIATPPASHYELVKAAADHGKHCLCEKPLAMNTDQADEMLAAAGRKGLIAPVNFILRYNAVTEAVKTILESGVMGEVLSARLTNCASDTPLGPRHWFWDKSVSGGIFIEHGVHFFDLYRYWLGPGRVISAHAETREGTSQEDRVMCEVRHDGGAIVSHYHGFDQVAPMDRTDHRLVCEMGDIRVAGWIPLSLSVDVVVDDQGAALLADCAPGCTVTVLDRFDGERAETTGRGKDRRITRRLAVDFTPQPDKQAVYADSVRRLLADQIAFIRDARHSRRVTEQNGRDSLALAQAAATLASR